MFASSLFLFVLIYAIFQMLSQSEIDAFIIIFFLFLLEYDILKKTSQFYKLQLCNKKVIDPLAVLFSGSVAIYAFADQYIHIDLGIISTSPLLI